MPIEFSPKLLHFTMFGKNFKCMEFTFLENALIRGIFTQASPHSKRVSKFLPSRLRQKEITHSPRQHSFENLRPPTAERDEGNYDLFYQKSENMKITWMEH